MIQVPGKIFLLGEYSVMYGGQAIVAAIHPPYQVENKGKLHVDSPAAKFLQSHLLNADLQVCGGPGAPGFGTSTAELLAANQYLANPLKPAELWSWYRERFYPASGADLAVQLESQKDGPGIYQFQIHGDSYRILQVAVPHLFLSNCFIFRCPKEQKIPTHRDLENPKKAVVDQKIADQLIHRWLNGFHPSVLSDWAEYLAQLGYESLFGQDVRNAFQSVEGVAGVKGCGAGLNDVFLVAIDQSNPIQTMKMIHRIAENFELTFMGSLHERV